MHINEDELSDICVKNINNDSMIPITIEDPRMGEYIKIYKDMKTLYLDNCDTLLRKLENDILDKSKVVENNENNEKMRFTIKNIGYEELVKLETDVRNILVVMYSTCHEQYQKGMAALFNALKPQKIE